MDNDDQNRLVLSQKPNLPILVAVGASAVSLISFVNIFVGEFFVLIAFGAWFTWAWLELFQGVNIIRRILGGIVMLALLVVAMVLLYSTCRI